MDGGDVVEGVGSVALEAAVLVDIGVAGLAVAQRELVGVAVLAAVSRRGDDRSAVDLVAGAAEGRAVGLELEFA